MEVGDMVAVNVEKVFLGFVTESDPGWVYIHFLDGDTGSYDLDELEWDVVSESR